MKCLSFKKCSKYYLIILFSFIIKFLIHLLFFFGAYINDYHDVIRTSIFDNKLRETLDFYIFNYILIFLVSLFCFFKDCCNKKKLNKGLINDDGVNILSLPPNSFENCKNYFSQRYSLSRQIIKNLDFSSLYLFEFFIIHCFINRLNKTEFYIHQKFSLIIICICFVIKMISFLIKTRDGENITKFFGSDEGILKFLIPAYLLSMIGNSYSIMKFRNYFYVQMYSIYHSMFLVGFLGTIIPLGLLLLLKLVYFFTNEKEKSFFSEDFSFGLIEIISLILIPFLSLCKIYCDFLILKHLGIFQYYIPDIMFYCFKELWNLIYISKEFNGKINISCYYYISLFAHIIIFFGAFIYFEIIILHFCNLDKDNKEKLWQKGIVEIDSDNKNELINVDDKE